MIDEELIKNNEKLIYFTLKKLHLYHKSDEFVDIGYIGLIKGLNSYNPNTGFKLSTYLIKCITNEVLHEINRKNQKRNIPEENLYHIDDIFISDANVNIEKDLIIEESNNKLYEAILKLNFKERYVINHSFGLSRFEKMRNKDIAVILNVKENTVARIKSKAIKKLKNNLKIYMKN